MVMPRQIIALLLSIFIISNSIPLMASADDTGGITPRRAGNVTFDKLRVLTPTQPFFENGIFANGNFGIEVNFTLAQEMMNVNVTVNVTHSDLFERSIFEHGNLAAGKHSVNAGNSFNFTDPGFYTINATVEGWLNGTGMIDGFKKLVNVNFTTIIDFTINFSIDAPDVDGIYPKENLAIETVIKNTGNDFAYMTNVSIDITNTTGEISEVLQWSWKIEDFLPPDVESGVLIFFWTPSAEGPNSIYDITITATNESTGRSVNRTVQVGIMNIADIHLVNLTGFGDTGGIPSKYFDVTVLLNNTGNAVGTGIIHLEIYPAADPTDILIDLTNTSGNVTPEEGTASTREEASVIFQGLSIDIAGDYKVKASLVSTAEVLIMDLVIDACPCLELDISNVLLSPDPTSNNVFVGEEIIFSVVYKDLYGDVGTVKLYIDNVSHDMVTNGSTTWKSGVTFTYSWTATPGNHSYHFIGTDGLATFLKEHVDNNFTIYDSTGGWLRGKIRDVNGINVPGVFVVI